MACGDVLSLEDLQTAKKHQIFEAEVITGKVGGVAGGATIDTTTNPVTGQTQQTLPSILADLGFDVQSWTSSTGGVLASANQVFLNDTHGSLGLGDYYAWGGTFPKTVPAGTDPALPTSGYIMRSSRFASTQAREALRRSYAEAGYNLVDGSFEAGGTLVNANDVLLQERTGKAFSGPAGAVAAGTNPASGGFVDVSSITLGRTIKMLSAMVGATYSAASISNALLNASSANARVVVDGNYVVNGVITLPSNCDLFFMPLSSIAHITGDTDLFIGVDKSNITFTNPVLVQKASAITDRFTSCINLTRCQGATVSRGTLSGFTHTGVLADKCSDVTVTRSLFTDVGSTVFTNSTDISFYNGSINCIAEYNTCISGSNHGIKMQLGATNCRVVYNTVKNCGAYGIISYDIDEAQISESVIAYNTIDNILGSVIYQGQSQKFSGAGIYLLNSRNMQVTNNTIKNTNIQTEGETLVPGAIATNGARGTIVIKDNIIEDPRWYGIALSTESPGYEGIGKIEVSGGSISGRSLALAKAAIYVKARGNVTIDGVEVSSTFAQGNTGIMLTAGAAGSKPNRVINNKLSNVTIGVNAIRQNKLQVSGNNVDTVGTGIRLDNCTTSNLVGGIISGHTFAGVDVNNSTQCNVSDVVFDSTTAVDDIWTRGTCTGTSIAVKQRTGKLNNTGVGSRVIDHSDVGMVSYRQVGDTSYFRNVVAGGFIGNVCTTAGASGTAVVKNFGAIAP